MTFHKGRKSRKVIRHRQLTDTQLIRRHIEEYKHQIAIGRDPASALKYLRESTKGTSSIDKLRLRVNVARNAPSVTGVSLEGIRVTDTVKSYIKHLEAEHIIEPYRKGQSSLRFIGKPMFPYLLRHD